MSLKRLSNSELHNSFKGAVQTERNSLKDVLLHVIEVDRRQMYFDFNCSSLFSYMTEVMGYSNGPAQRRIDAARLSYEVPQLVETIESGALNLDQIRLMQQSIRQVAKESHKPVTSEQKIQVLNEIVGKSLAESEVIVASSFDVKIKTSVRIQRQADESVRMEISFSKEKWAKLEEMRTLLSHSLPTGSWDDVFEYVADKVIQQKSKLVEKRKYTKESQSINLSNTVSGTAIRSARTAIPVEIERQVFRRDQYCQQRIQYQARNALPSGSCRLITLFQFGRVEITRSAIYNFSVPGTIRLSIGRKRVYVYFGAELKRSIFRGKT